MVEEVRVEPGATVAAAMTRTTRNALALALAACGFAQQPLEPRVGPIHGLGLLAR